jgi:hypothetical protein
MTTLSSLGIEAQLALRIERETAVQLDTIIESKIKVVAENFSLKYVSEKSPFRNVLAMSLEPISSLEAIKVFIMSQVGKSGANPIWKSKAGDKLFAQAVVENIRDLDSDAKEILNRVKESVSLKSDLEVSHNKLLSDLKVYLDDTQNYNSLLKKLHLRLTQLYLGYLVREHCGLEGIQKNNAEGKQESKNQSDASNTHSVKPQSKSPKSR